MKKMIPLTNEESKSHRKEKHCYICKKEFNTDNEDKNTIKYEITAITLNTEQLLIIFVT